MNHRVMNCQDERSDPTFTNFERRKGGDKKDTKQLLLVFLIAVFTKEIGGVNKIVQS